MNDSLLQILIYGGTFSVAGWIIYYYIRKQGHITRVTGEKVSKAKRDGMYEPVSLHPVIDLNTCIGSGACIEACPEKDILGLSNGQATLINASQCVGHGACFHACPVEAITLCIGTEKRGVELPHINQNFETNVKGIYIAGELGGMGLIKNSVEQGRQAVENILKDKNHVHDDEVLDLIIVGAGPAGISASLTAKKHGLRFKTLEQDSLGGTVYTFPRSKVVMTAPMDLPLHGKMKLFDTSKKELLDIWLKVLGENEIEIQERTKVDAIEWTRDQHFLVKTNSNHQYKTSNVLLAIGRRGSPRKLNVPGEDSVKVAYRLLEPENIENKRILVVGGGDSAVESAMLVMDKNEVWLSYRKEAFSRIKPKNRERITEAIERGQINMLFNTNVVEIRTGYVSIENNQSKEIINIPNDLVYIFAGGILPTKFLQDAGIEIKKRFGYALKSYKK